MKKTPFATRTVEVYKQLDAVLLDLNALWIDGLLNDAEFHEKQRACLKVAEVLAAEVNKLFRSGLDIVNRWKAKKDQG